MKMQLAKFLEEYFIVTESIGSPEMDDDATCRAETRREELRDLIPPLLEEFRQGNIDVDKECSSPEEILDRMRRKSPQ